MDAFYASVEQRDHPEYRGKPIVVGGSPQGRGGVVATASYEARKFGIHSAMPSKRALDLCPEVIFVYPRFAAYKEVSNQVREIFHRFTDLVEPLSLDEAYLDVSEDKLGIGSAIDIAERIRSAIKQELHLTASAGVSINKFVAKIASDLNKPDGLSFISPAQVLTFMEQLPVEKFFGVGKVTAQKMRGMGLHTGADLKRLTEQEISTHFGKSGRFFYQVVRGIDERPVRPFRETKSIGAEDTFPFDLYQPDQMDPHIEDLAQKVSERLRKNGLSGKTVTLKIKYQDFQQITRAQSLFMPSNDAGIIGSVAKDLLHKCRQEGRGIRLLGITLSGFQAQGPKRRPGIEGQLELFEPE